MARKQLARLALTLLVVGGSAGIGYAMFKVFSGQAGDAGSAPGEGLIAWDAVDQGQRDIFVSNPDGFDLVNLTNDRWREDTPEWSPDGRKIVFFRTELYSNFAREIIVMDVATGQRTLVGRIKAETITEPAWSPDGTLIAFAVRDESPYVVPAGGGSPLREVAPGSAVSSEISWSPDGKRLLFGAFEGGSLDGDIELFTAAVDGSSVTQLTDDNRAQLGPRWSPTGEWISFSTFSLEGYDPQDGLQLMRPDGSERHVIANGVWDDVAWSPDGTRMLVNYQIGHSARTWGQRLAVVGVDGSVRVLKGLPDPHDYGWSPDGQRIVYQGGYYCDGGVYVVQADGTGRTRISWGAGVGASPDWGPATIRPVPGPTVTGGPTPSPSSSAHPYPEPGPLRPYPSSGC